MKKMNWAFRLLHATTENSGYIFIEICKAFRSDIKFYVTIYAKIFQDLF